MDFCTGPPSERNLDRAIGLGEETARVGVIGGFEVDLCAGQGVADGIEDLDFEVRDLLREEGNWCGESEGGGEEAAAGWDVLDAAEGLTGFDEGLDLGGRKVGEIV